MGVRTKRVLPVLVLAALVGAGLLIARPDALRGDAGAGCAVDDLSASELARNEARYLPIELMVTLGVGIELAREYMGYAEAVLQGQELPAGSCFVAEVVEEDDLGGGTVRFTFAGCNDRSGAIAVKRVAAPPPEEEPEPDPPAAVAPPIFGTGTFVVTFAEYLAHGVHLDGTLGIAAAAGGGQIDSDIAIDFLDYAGTLDAEGPWTPVADKVISVGLEGAYRSVTGLDWDVTVADLVLDTECLGAKSGEMRGHYGNEMGDVDALARFDGSCDGCAAAFVNEEEQSRLCIPEGVLP